MAELLPVHVQQRADAELGAAWRRCETALPDGAELVLSTIPRAFGEPIRSTALIHPASRHSRQIGLGMGPTPIAALAALAEALESR